MPLHVLRHIKTYQLNAHDAGELATDFGLTNPSGTGKQEGADGFVTVLETSPRQLDGTGKGTDGLVLAKNHHAQVGFQILQGFLVRGRHCAWRNAGNLGYHLFDIRNRNQLLALAGWQQLLIRTHLINHINGFIRHKTVIDIPICKLCGHAQGPVCVLEVVMLLKTSLQALENLVGILNAGLSHINFLEPPGQGPVLIKNTPVFLIGG